MKLPRTKSEVQEANIKGQVDTNFIITWLLELQARLDAIETLNNNALDDKK